MSTKKIIDWFVPGHLQADEQTYIRAKLNVGVAFSLGIAALIYGSLYSMMHHPLGAVAIVITILFFIFPAPFVMRFTGSLKIAGHLIQLGMLLLVVYLSLTTGGHYSQGIIWFVTVPVLATLLAGFAAGIVWGILTIITVLSFYILEISGRHFKALPLTPAEDLTFRFIVLAGLILIVLAFTLLFEGLKNSALKKSKAAYEQLKETFFKITENAEKLADSSNKLTAESEIIEQNAADSLEKVTRMVEGTDEVNQNIQHLAASIDQITGSVKDISIKTGEAAEVSEKAVAMVDAVNKMIARLDENNKEIGKMTGIITGIGFQTNLLALNAAIEAARAGEAGRGFAVVAGAVRELSLQASDAAKKISESILIVQEDTQKSIDIIKKVNELIYTYHNLMNDISAAVTEQTTTLTEMSQNAGKAANETARIAEGNQLVSNASGSTAEGIGSVILAAKEVSEIAGQLQGLTEHNAI